MKLTTFEIDVITGVLNMRGTGGIRDLRLIDRVSKKVSSSKPVPAFEAPKMKEAAVGTIPSQEDKDEHKKLVDEYNKKMLEFQDFETEVGLSDTENGIIKQRLKTFGGYFTDNYARDRIIKLADKLGI